MTRMAVRSLVMLAVVFVFYGVTAPAQNGTYDQPFRPQVHFSPHSNWTNDPNGLVYFQGEYHLFFQYNPFGDQWGHMSWGHAVSPDLVHWKELPVAIPEADGIMIFTGSVVVDHDNTSGLCSSGSACLIAVYTGDGNTPQGHRETQNIAYSRDKGRSWTKYKNNPVLDLHLADFRDPNVFWDLISHRWIMAVSLPKEHKVRFYSSPNLKEWTQLSDFGPAGDTDGDWECPDLLQIPASNGKGMIWALKVGLNPGAPQGGSGEQYFLGSFDGKTFTSSPDQGANGWTNYGKDDYCAISFNGLPKEQNPVLLGWMSNWQYAAKLPTSPWRGQMSLPRRLTFVKDAAGLALQQDPVLVPLREKSILFPGAGKSDLDLFPPYELEMQFGHPSTTTFGVRLYYDEHHWTEIGFDLKKSVFYVDRSQSGSVVAAEFSSRTEAPLAATRPYDLKLVVDRSSIEAFAQNGTIAMTDLVFPSQTKTTVRPFSEGQKASSVSGRVWQLKSIWPQPQAVEKDPH